MLRVPRVDAQFAQQREAVQAGHHDVRQHEIGRLATGGDERLAIRHRRRRSGRSRARRT